MAPTIGRALLAVGALALVTVTVGPELILRRAQAATEPCFAGPAAVWEADLEACIPGGRWFDAAAGMWGFRGRAAGIRSRAERKVAELRYARATTVAPDAAVRDRSAAELLTGRRDALAETVDRLPGAFGVVAGRGLEAPELAAVGEMAARAIGDGDALGAYARSDKEGRESWRDLRHAAVQCLSGDRGRGLVKLRTVADGRASRAVGLAILGGRACRGNESTFADRRQLPDELGLVDVALALSQDRPGATEQVGRLLDDVGALDAWERATLGAAWIGKTRPTAARARQVLAGATFSDSGSSEITTPWSLVAENGALRDVIDAKAVEDASAHLRQLTNSQEEGCEGTCRGDLESRARELAGAALDERLRAGRIDQEGARRLLADTSPADRWRLAPRLLAHGEPRAALAALDDPRGLVADTDVGQHATSRVHALVALGRMADAHREAGDALWRGRQTQVPLATDPSAVALEDPIVLAWLWAATSLDVGQAADVGQRLRQLESPAIWSIARYLEGATKPETERRSERATLQVPPLPAAALPAAMHLFARWLPEGADAEVWLDHLFSTEHRRQPLRAMAARAEAARWRGDHVAADRWTTRLRTLQQQGSDYPRAVLATMAGLR